MIIRFKNVALDGLSYYVPERIVSNQEIIDANSLKMKDSWISTRIGIDTRRWAAPEQAASDLAVEAFRRLPNTSLRDGSLWVSTISQDYLTPSTSSIIKGKLGMTQALPALDLSAACAGQIFALELAATRLAVTSESSAVVIATEVRSRFLNKKDRRTVFLFGDGAAAMSLTKTEKGFANLNWTHCQTIPSSEFEILVPAGGSVHPVDIEALEGNQHCIKMNDGEKIVEATGEALVGGLLGILSSASEKVSDYDFFVFHQGNGSIIRGLCERLGVGVENTWINFNKFGNTSSASAGIALAEAFEANALKPGARVLMVAMGAGYHVGVASWTFHGGSRA